MNVAEQQHGRVFELADILAYGARNSSIEGARRSDASLSRCADRIISEANRPNRVLPEELETRITGVSVAELIGKHGLSSLEAVRQVSELERPKC